MKPIPFPEQTLVVAKDQPQYRPIPAHYDHKARTLTAVWRLTFRERLKVLFTGKLWHQVFDMPLQPVKLTVDKPEMKPQ